MVLRLCHHVAIFECVWGRVGGKRRETEKLGRVIHREKVCSVMSDVCALVGQRSPSNGFHLVDWVRVSQSLLICSLEQVGWAETLSPSPQLRDYEWEAPCLVVNEYSRSNSGPHGFKAIILPPWSWCLFLQGHQCLNCASPRLFHVPEWILRHLSLNTSLGG